MPSPFAPAHPLNGNAETIGAIAPDLLPLHAALASCTDWDQSKADLSASETAAKAEPEAQRVCCSIVEKMIPTTVEHDALKPPEVDALASPAQSTAPSTTAFSTLIALRDVVALSEYGSDLVAPMQAVVGPMPAAGTGPFGAAVAMEAGMAFGGEAVTAVVGLVSGAVPTDANLSKEMHEIKRADVACLALDRDEKDDAAELKRQELPGLAQAGLQHGMNLIGTTEASLKQAASIKQLVLTKRSEANAKSNEGLALAQRKGAVLEATKRLLLNGKAGGRALHQAAKAELAKKHAHLAGVEAENAQAKRRIENGCAGLGLGQMVKLVDQMQCRGAAARNDVAVAKEVVRRVAQQLDETENSAVLRTTNENLAQLDATLAANIEALKATRDAIDRVFVALLAVVAAFASRQTQVRRQLVHGCHQLVELYLPLAFRDKVETARQSEVTAKEELEAAEYDHKLLKRGAASDKAAKLKASMRKREAARAVLTEAEGFAAQAKAHISEFVAQANYEAACTELGKCSIVPDLWKKKTEPLSIMGRLVALTTRALTGGSTSG